MHGRIGLAGSLAALIVFPLAPTAAAATYEFPAGYEDYHTFSETVAEIDQAVADHPAIASKMSIGKTFEGRDIWVVKISDNVGTDEDEPEVLSTGLMHARERLTTEMNLYMIHLLTDNYGQPGQLGARITSIVNSREIWIIPMHNPDGGEYDILDGEWRNWRKNRQPIPGTDEVGVDLNRNFGYNWGCCGGSSGKPSAPTYRGQFPWQAPENVALRDFILSRRVGGHQQIRAIFNWHSYGEFITWPFGYTKVDVPPTMTLDDHKSMVAIGRHMASLNGYSAKQGSDSYIYDGDFLAWAYGDQRIIGFTFEMFPKWGSNAGGFHPVDDVIPAETARNRDAALYFIEQADCPYRAAGLGATHCGPLNDDFETDRGWTIDPHGADTATSGSWQRGVPQKTRDAAGVKQRIRVPSGQAALVTGLLAGANVNANDVDGGTTSALSGPITLGSGAWTLNLRYSFAHGANSSADDFLRVSVVRGGTVTPRWTVLGKAANRNARWRSKSLGLNAFAGQTIRLLIEARDGAADSLVEAALDNVRIYQTP